MNTLCFVTAIDPDKNWFPHHQASSRDVVQRAWPLRLHSTETNDGNQQAHAHRSVRRTGSGRYFGTHCIHVEASVFTQKRLIWLFYLGILSFLNTQHLSGRWQGMPGIRLGLSEQGMMGLFSFAPHMIPFNREKN